jgi:hypothetical protein
MSIPVPPARGRRPAPVARRAAVLAVLPLLAACGETLTDKTTRAMLDCIERRRPAFVEGRGGEALSIALAPETEAIATEYRYKAAFDIYQAWADNAPDQVTLVCALDLASRFKDPDVKAYVGKYRAHPDAPVARAADALLSQYQQ